MCCNHAGYLIGLGDRHCQNILLDCDTAECVHIDLGIAFEQGRFLPTPEQVPFRLTRDLIDGMGAAGQLCTVQVSQYKHNGSHMHANINISC